MVYSAACLVKQQGNCQSSTLLPFLWGDWSGHRLILLTMAINGENIPMSWRLPGRNWSDFNIFWFHCQIWAAHSAYECSTHINCSAITHQDLLSCPNLPKHEDEYVLSNYREASNIIRTLVGNKIVDHSDVVGASPVGAAPTTSSFSTSQSGFKRFGKDSRKTVREYLCWDLVSLILETWRQIRSVKKPMTCSRGFDWFAE